MRENEPQPGYGVCVGCVLAIILLCIITSLTGCKSQKEAAQTLPVVPIENETNTKVIHVETIDTIFIEIPAQSAENTTVEGFSHLETDYAQSDARINADGTLTHTLRNKPQPQPVPVKISTDTIHIETIIEKPVPVQVPQLVERELTAWERTRLKTWGWLLTALLILIGWTFRKPLVGIIARILKKTP